MSVHLDICNVHDEYNNKTPHLINMDQIFSLINQKALHDVQCTIMYMYIIVCIR